MAWWPTWRRPWLEQLQRDTLDALAQAIPGLRSLDTPYIAAQPRECDPDGGDDVLFRNLNVQGEHRGQGVAHELLRRGVERFGDRRIELKAAPYQDEPLSQEQLMGLYGKHGFVPAPDKGDGRMVRSPETQESVDQRVAGIRELLEEVLKEPCPSCGRRMLRKSPGGKVFCPAAYCEYHR